MKKKQSIHLIESIKKNYEFTVKTGENKIIFILLTNDDDQSGDVKVFIDGENANVQILGAIIGSGSQNIRLYTYQDHSKKESVSDLFIKSVLFDCAKLSYEGLIKIEKGAQKSNAYQKNQNLLIGKKAWADTRPKLEILANDVRCTHGATIGKINDEEVYYLQTRGLTIDAANRLIIKGFLQDVIDRIPDEKMKVELIKKMEYKVDICLNSPK